MNVNTYACANCADAREEHVLVQVRGRLRLTGYQVLHQIECEYRDGTVALRGRVPSFHHKQVAQSALVACPGVNRVLNYLEVAENLV